LEDISAAIHILLISGTEEYFQELNVKVGKINFDLAKYNKGEMV
jgi:hypothetical protein